MRFLVLTVTEVLSKSDGLVVAKDSEGNAHTYRCPGLTVGSRITIQEDEWPSDSSAPGSPNP